LHCDCSGAIRCTFSIRSVSCQWPTSRGLADKLLADKLKEKVLHFSFQTIFFLLSFLIFPVFYPLFLIYFSFFFFPFLFFFFSFLPSFFFIFFLLFLKNLFLPFYFWIFRLYTITFRSPFWSFSGTLQFYCTPSLKCHVILLVKSNFSQRQLSMYAVCTYSGTII